MADEDSVWVQIDFVKSNNSGVQNCRGVITADAFKGLVTGSIRERFLKVESYYWVNKIQLQDKWTFELIPLNKTGLNKNFTGVGYVRVDQIVGIYPLKDNSDFTSFPVSSTENVSITSGQSD